MYSVGIGISDYEIVIPDEYYISPSGDLVPDGTLKDTIVDVDYNNSTANMHYFHYYYSDKQIIGATLALVIIIGLISYSIWKKFFKKEETPPPVKTAMQKDLEEDFGEFLEELANNEDDKFSERNIKKIKKYFENLKDGKYSFSEAKLIKEQILYILGKNIDPVVLTSSGVIIETDALDKSIIFKGKFVDCLDKLVNEAKKKNLSPK